jgi:hypothetical protein
MIPARSTVRLRKRGGKRRKGSGWKKRRIGSGRKKNG